MINDIFGSKVQVLLSTYLPTISSTIIFFYFQAWLDGKETTLLRPIYRGLPFAQENETC